MLMKKWLSGFLTCLLLCGLVVTAGAKAATASAFCKSISGCSRRNDKTAAGRRVQVALFLRRSLLRKRRDLDPYGPEC